MNTITLIVVLLVISLNLYLYNTYRQNSKAIQQAPIIIQENQKKYQKQDDDWKHTFNQEGIKLKLSEPRWQELRKQTYQQYKQQQYQKLHDIITTIKQYPNQPKPRKITLHPVIQEYYIPQLDYCLAQVNIYTHELQVATHNKHDKEYTTPHIYIHETTHLKHHQSHPNINELRTPTQPFLEARKQIKQTYSYYASTNPVEFVAEVYTHNLLYKTQPPTKLLELYNEFIGPQLEECQ